MSNQKYNNHSIAVREFTEARLGRPVPNAPTKLSVAAVRKYLGLCMSEMVELARTVTDSNADALEMVRSCLGMDAAKVEPTFANDIDIVGSQADAMVDLEYYSRDIACEHGINLDNVFDAVHDANMLKKFPDGTFHTDEIAPGVFKVIKPPGWVQLGVPNIDLVMEQDTSQGSWSDRPQNQ